MRAYLIPLVLVSVAIPALTFGGWFSSEPTAQETNEKVQEDVMQRAQSVEPVYQPQNFLSRQAINKWTKRLDTPDKLWYVYLMTESGAFIGYHVCKTVPLSYGVSITSPAREYETGPHSSAPDPIGPAPGVDGVYYSNTSSDTHYCFDAETNALITFNTQFVYYDKPVNIDAPELNIVNKE